MSEPILVTDAADPRLDDFRDLTLADRRPDRPGGRGLVIAEGTVVVRRLLGSAYPVRALLGVQRRFDELRDDLAATAAPYYVLTAEVMAAVVGFHLNRGGAGHRRPRRLPAGRRDAGGRVIGGGARRGRRPRESRRHLPQWPPALGIGAVLLGPGCSDPLYRRSVRVSMGTVLLVPFATLDGDWPAPADLLRSNGFQVVAMTPRPSAPTLRSAGLAGRRVALLLGSEGPGLTDAALDAADLLVRIPMAAGVDSLNVATAGAIAFAEIAQPGAAH